MSVLRSLEEKIAGLVEGTFGRVFRSEVRPVELARKLANEMDEAKSVSVSLTGATQLRLVVGDAGDGVFFDHADWADARVACTP